MVKYSCAVCGRPVNRADRSQHLIYTEYLCPYIDKDDDPIEMHDGSWVCSKDCCETSIEWLDLEPKNYFPPCKSEKDPKENKNANITVGIYLLITSLVIAYVIFNCK